MQFPITIGLHRSHFLGRIIAAAHMLAATVVLITPWLPGQKALFLAGITGSAALVWRRRQSTVDYLRLLENGRMECRLAGEDVFVEAELLPAATVHPWLTVVPLKIAGQRVVIIVPPDSIHTEDFRRLRVWLRWRAGFSAAKNAV